MKNINGALIKIVRIYDDLNGNKYRIMFYSKHFKAWSKLSDFKTGKQAKEFVKMLEEVGK